MIRLSTVLLGVSSLALVGCTSRLEIDDDGDGFTVVEDCNDQSAATYPGAPEACDGVDNNCDGAIDETDECTDADGDGSPFSVDCDDDDSNTFPGATERCDGADNNCDGVIDEGTECFDNDGDGASADEGDCNDANANTFPGAEEVCDGLDNDCDGDEDEGIDCSNDSDNDGFTVDQGDCDDTSDAVFPDAPEICDSLDNNCNSTIDEGTNCFDDDRDGQSEDNGDCDDANPATFTGALEVCDGIDNNCDNAADEGIDCSGDGDGDGFTVDQGDCDDTSGLINPDAVEICNERDDNCNGDIDEMTECADDDNDGFTENEGDCDDADPAINPGAEELTDGIDNDCDDEIDENIAECDVDEFEPNDTFDQSDAVGIDAQVCGTIDEAGDVDWFSIAVDDWSYLTLDIDADVLDSELDSVVTLFQATADGPVEVASNDDDEFGSDFDSYLDIFLPVGGTYYAVVTDFFEDGGDTYTYEMFTNGYSFCDVIESEAIDSATDTNRSTETAETVGPDDIACGYVRAWNDFDYYAVAVNAGDTVTFDLDAYEYNTGLEAQMTLRGTNGITILLEQRPEGTEDPFFSWTFEDGGTYYLEVESDLINIRDVGAYALWMSRSPAR
ncbi:MAG: hypothetical protein ACJAZO_002853 [Myxococcota bacterium]